MKPNQPESSLTKKFKTTLNFENYFSASQNIEKAIECAGIVGQEVTSLTFTLQTGLVGHWFAAQVTRCRVADGNTDELVRGARRLILTHLCA